MLLTALPPPPPTPITRMFAWFAFVYHQIDRHEVTFFYCCFCSLLLLQFCGEWEGGEWKGV